jgi:hypothetical protein
MTGLPPELSIVHLTNHWSLIHGAWYRDAWVQGPSGLRFVAILDELL